MVLEENQVSSMYYDGPPTRQWEVVTEACIFVPLDLEDADKAAYLAARLNDLDAARARIALLEARLAALCGAVEAERTVMDTTPDDVRNRLYLAAYEATQQAREVLGG